MLYLSLLLLNPRSRQVQSELRDPYQMHRTLAKAFGEGEAAQAAARCLFRVEEDGQGVLRLLVQSQVPPLWEELTAPPDYLSAPPQVKEFAPAFRSGQPLAFRLRANPTKRQAAKAEGSKMGARVGLYTEEERLAWLRRQGIAHGFAVQEARLISESASACRAQSNRAVFSAVRFEGVLRVTDPPALLNALAGGIGAGKGFGFGLLSVSRLK